MKGIRGRHAIDFYYRSDDICMKFIWDAFTSVMGNWKSPLMTIQIIGSIPEHKRYPVDIHLISIIL